MKTMLNDVAAGANGRRMGFSRAAASRAWRQAVVGLCCLALGAASAGAASEPTYKLFGREIGGYTSKDELPGIVKKELGSRASIADWNDIKKQFGQSEASLRAFCDQVGLAREGSAWVTLGGKRFAESQRGYFIFRADHQPPGDFGLHDQLQDRFLLLGSWFDARPILVRITGFTAADAAKWAKWDQMLAARAKLAEAKAKAIAGVYKLATVNGKPVPTAVAHEGANLEVRSGTFTITAEGTCQSQMTFVPPSGKEATVNTSATYILQGTNLNQLKMQWRGAGMTDGTIAGETFTMDNEGMVFGYKK